MISKGSLVRYVGGNRKEAWRGRLLAVSDRRENEVDLYTQDNKGRWKTFTVDIKDLEEVR